MTNIQCFLTNEYHPIHEGHGNRENDHQLNKLLIVKIIYYSLSQYLRRYTKNSMENMRTDVIV